MRATLMFGAGDVRVGQVSDPRIEQPTDALVRIVRACICGSDLHPYHDMDATSDGAPMGHEMLGVVEEVGSEVGSLRAGDFVVSPFAISDNTCQFCREGLHTSCEQGTFFGPASGIGLQAEAARVPLADGTLVRVGREADAVTSDPGLTASLLSLSDVFLTGHHAAVLGRVGPGTTVTVIGDGAVGLSAVLASQRLGADRIILMGRHTDRTDLGRRFGATDVVAERGEEGIAKVQDLLGPLGGSHVVLEAVGHLPAYEMALGVVRPGGIISRVGVPQYDDASAGTALFGKTVTLTGGAAPVRAYLDELLPEVLDGRIEPGLVFDRTVPLERTPDGYRAMDDRESIKVMVTP